MSLQSMFFQITASASDRKRDAQIPLPEGVVQCRNISYDAYGENSLLDVYYPSGTQQPLPTIVSIHGGGYVYGNKEIYRRYGMDMASRGFSFVNFNYRLATKWRFPAPLADTNKVMEWIRVNAQRYHLDPDRIILVGDSAGAQLASQYAAIQTNPKFASLFQVKPAKIRIRALGLNCGLYDVSTWMKRPRRGLAADYLGKDISEDDPRMKVLEAIDGNYPPAFITTSWNDFLRENARPMHEFLQKKGVESQWKCYGAPENNQVAHVFHVNIRLPEAVACNDDSAAFFRRFV